MKTKFFLLAVLIILNSSFLIHNCDCQWVQMKGLFGGNIRAISVDLEKVTVGTSRGVYISSDGGEIWDHTSLNYVDVICLAKSNDTLFAGTYNKGIYKSTNFGSNWIQCLPNLYTVFSIVIIGNMIFAATDGDIFKSNDGGQNWIPTNIPAAMAYDINIIGNNIISRTGINSLIISTDYANSWVSYNSSINISDMHSTGNLLYGCNSDGIWVSSNYGENWTATSLIVTPVSVIFANGNKLFASNNNKIYKSTNSGFNWTQSSFNGRNCTGFGINGNTIFLCSISGNFCSTNNGDNWSNIGPDANTVHSITQNGNVLFSGSNHGVNYSSNNGLNWLETALNNSNSSIKAVTAFNNSIFAGSSAVYKSTNNGLTWDSVGMGNRTISSFVSLGNNLFVSAAGSIVSGVFRSTDNGLNWMQTLLTRFILSLEVKENKIFAGSQDSGVYVSSDYGDSWSKTSLNNQLILSLTSNGYYVFAGSFYNGVYKTSNNGLNWIQTGLNRRANSLIALNNLIVAGTSDSGIFVSNDNGENWIKKNEGLNLISPITTLFISNGYIFASLDGQSLWRRQITEIISVKNIGTKIPSEFSLEQNYPNPFNSMTKVKFKIANTGIAKIFVTDMLGRQIETLVDEYFKPGTYSVVWNASNQASGIYFYTLSVPGYRETKRMTLIK